MKKARFILAFISVLMIVGCSPVIYKKAALSGWGEQQGYLDRKISEG
jgi:hypothetical protein